MTGSTTRWGRSPAAALWATVATMAADASMPVFTAATGRSQSTASICRSTNSGSNTLTPRTAVVFWAVTAVRTLVPNTPRAAKVFRSAWMPAPPPESEPAMVMATGGFTGAGPQTGGSSDTVPSAGLEAWAEKRRGMRPARRAS